MPTFTTVKGSPRDTACDVLAVPVFKDLALGPGAREVEQMLDVPLAEVIEQAPLMAKPFTGDLGQAIAIPTLGALQAKQVLLIGLGDRTQVRVFTARRAGAVLARKLGGARRVATTIPQAVKGAPDAAIGAFVEGFLLASYRYERYKAKRDGRPNRVEEVLLFPSGKGWEPRKVRAAIDRAEAVAEGTNLARDLTNTPAFDKSPESLAGEARRLAKNGLKVKVLDEKELAAKGFGGILGVGRGSPKPPRLIQLRYEPAGAKRTIAIVGKGITFDSGGINLKPTDGLGWMKMDMGGGAAVLGTMAAIARLKPRVAVHGYIATSENMPDGDALRPGDVITQYGGRTVEIGNTDAEGRLVMADAIVYAKEQGADVVLDIATLTGACIVALGNKMFGVIGEPRTEVRRVLDAAERAGEPAWELPLNRDYRSALDSDIADIRNISSKNVGAGTITAALFLKEFAGDTPWVHLDIAGPVNADSDDYERPKAATGAGVRTLVEYVLAH